MMVGERPCCSRCAIREHTVRPFPIPSVVRWIGRRPFPFPQVILAFCSSKYLRTSKNFLLHLLGHAWKGEYSLRDRGPIMPSIAFGPEGEAMSRVLGEFSVV